MTHLLMRGRDSFLISSFRGRAHMEIIEIHSHMSML